MTDTQTSKPRVSKALDGYGPWTLPQLALLVENVATCLDHGSSTEACAAELRGIAKHIRASSPPLDALRHQCCAIGIVGRVDGHDVVRRDSVIDLIDRARASETKEVTQGEQVR